jgi:mono/diheme cytochrome c family protein
MREGRLFGAILAVLLAVGAAAGCRGMTSTKPPIHLNPNMDHQPKYRPQSESAFFYDGAAMREPVPGTVARGELREDTPFFEGKDQAGEDVVHSPVEATKAVLERGAERYAIYCAPCHDPRGTGKGILAQQGLPTTSFHIQRLHDAADGYLFEVITNGRGLMPAYQWPIPPADRWAIIAHVRELQSEMPVEDGGAAQ